MFFTKGVRKKYSCYSMVMLECPAAVFCIFLIYVAHLLQGLCATVTHGPTHTNTDTHTQQWATICSHHCKAKTCNMIKPFFFTWTQMHYMCQQEGSPVFNIELTLKVTLRCIMIVLTYIGIITYSHLHIFNSMWPLCGDKPRWCEHEWGWMPWGAGAVWSYVAGVWGCQVRKWATNHWQQYGNTEINHNRIQLSKAETTQQELKEGTKTTSCFLCRPQRVLLWSGLLQRLAGGVLRGMKGLTCYQGPSAVHFVCIPY